MRKKAAPRSRSGLPKGFERRLERHYGRTPGGRVKLAAALGALGVLVRHNPGVLLSMIGAGAVQAAGAGLQELTGHAGRPEKPEHPAPEQRRPLDRREARRFRKLLSKSAALPQ